MYLKSWSCLDCRAIVQFFLESCLWEKHNLSLSHVRNIKRPCARHFFLVSQWDKFMFGHIPRTGRLIAAAFFLCLLSSGSQAQPSQRDAEIQAAVAAMQKSAQPGPQDIALGNQGMLKLPEGFTFVPKETAGQFMRAVGNHVDTHFYGLVFNENVNGFVVIKFAPAGYIKDDEAKDWNADELLQNLKDGTEQGNQERADRGIPPIEVIGWVEKPAYEKNTHRLVWSASTRQKGSATAEKEQGVNYNTYVLGREGYLSLNLVTSRGTVENEKPLARLLLSTVAFNDGKRYEDFNASTDHVAEYGLAALVGGIAAKKLGLLATAGVFLAKFWKILAIVVIAFGASIKKLFGKKPASGFGKTE